MPPARYRKIHWTSFPASNSCCSRALTPEAAAQRIAQQTHKDRQLHLDLAFDYAAAGLFAEARALLSVCRFRSILVDLSHGLLLSGMIWRRRRETGIWRLNIEHWLRRRAPDYCFPSRLEEMRALEEALDRNPLDAKGAYYLGNLYYDKKRYEDAISLWEKSVALDAGFSIPWRNLGIAYFNIRHNPERATPCL